MREYLAVVILFNFMVNLLLILTANRLEGFSTQIIRFLMAAALGGLYGGFCMLPGFGFLGNALWRLVFWGIMGAIAFGCHSGSIHRCVMFVFLSMAFDGIVQGTGEGRVSFLLLGIAVLCGLCVFGSRGKAQNQEFVEVELSARGKKEKLIALRDTGNVLRDPVTGQSVLVADAKSAQTLLGLNKHQLSSPVETVASGIIPGLRLIPYRTVGQSTGMLVAVRLEKVRIGKWQGSSLVAFAPEGLGEDHTYRALTGGMV